METKDGQRPVEQPSQGSWLPTYPGNAPDPRASYREASVWREFDSIYACWESEGRPLPGPNPLLPPERRHTLMEALGEEAARLRPSKSMMGSRFFGDTKAELIAWAEPLARWAAAKTAVVTPAPLARFGVEAAYDTRVRSRIKELMADPRPSQWRWTTSRDSRGRLREFLLTDESCDGYVPPLVGTNVVKAKNLALDWAHVLRSDAIAEASWPFAYRARVFLDPLRPTIGGLQIAAKLVNLSCKMPVVAAVEMGHSIGAQALAAMIPYSRVYTDCAMYPADLADIKLPPGRADAVVVNIPGLRLLSYTEAVVMGGLKHVSRKINDAFHPDRWPVPGEDLDHVGLIVDGAIPYLKTGGLLLVLGDEEGGVHHEAIRLMDALPSFEPVVVEGRDTVARPFYTFRTRPAWRPFDVQGPTNRFVSAWRLR